jgi:transcriptional/translational regulatory protein YebC/TACO1
MDVALEAGADDVIAGDDGAIEVLCAPAEFESVQQALQRTGLKPDLAEVTWRAENPVELAAEDSQRMQKLLDVLEDLDDTQAVYHNAVLE